MDADGASSDVRGLREQASWGDLDALCAADRHFFSLKPDPKHDAYFCTRCRKWLEPKCEYPKCPYCPTRPERAP